MHNVYETYHITGLHGHIVRLAIVSNNFQLQKKLNNTGYHRVSKMSRRYPKPRHLSTGGSLLG